MRPKHAGTAFESTLEVVWQGYRQNGIADIAKVDPPTRVIRRGGKPVAIQISNPFLDYCGVWTEMGGRAIHIEAKSTEEPRLGISSQSGIRPTQVEAIQRWNRAGAVVGVVWHHRGDVTVLTGLEILTALASGARSIKWRHFRPLPRCPGLILWDVLGPLADRI